MCFDVCAKGSRLRLLGIFRTTGWWKLSLTYRIRGSLTVVLRLGRRTEKFKIMLKIRNGRSFHAGDTSGSMSGVS